MSKRQEVWYLRFITAFLAVAVARMFLRAIGVWP